MTVKRPKILAIDDTPVNLLTLGSVLEADYVLQFATSGAQGLALALADPPDLILLDVMMPQVDGFETFRQLAAQATLRHVPVIFVTALSDFGSEDAGLSLGAADYLTKPINGALARGRIHNCWSASACARKWRRSATGSKPRSVCAAGQRRSCAWPRASSRMRAKASRSPTWTERYWT